MPIVYLPINTLIHVSLEFSSWNTIAKTIAVIILEVKAVWPNNSD